jgi:hypothetical protein
MPWMIYDSGDANRLVTWERFATFDDAHAWVERRSSHLQHLVRQQVISGWTYVHHPGPVLAEDIARGWWVDDVP